MKELPTADSTFVAQRPAATRHRQRAFGAPAVTTALIVGTALTLINHPGIVGLDPGPGLLTPLLLNFVVPFLVAGYSRHRLLKRLSEHAPPSRVHPVGPSSPDPYHGGQAEVRSGHVRENAC
jgi:hypothetical protein